jgi:putative nucleotidyltransferase with HDIG domain
MWSFSKALDLALVDEEIEKGMSIPIGQRHGERVGYIALSIGKTLGLSQRSLVQLLIAGLMHDIGAVGGFHQYHGNPAMVKAHCLLGAQIVRRFPDGDILSRVIRYHHEAPNSLHSALNTEADEIPLMSKIIAIADKVDVNLSRRIISIKEKEHLFEWVKAQSGNQLFPEVVPAFLEAAGREVFWFDLEQPDLLQSSLALLYNMWYFPNIEEDINDGLTQELAQTFADLIDQKSDFTMQHSRMTAVNAERLAEGVGWKGQDIKEIWIAGLLHDLGKLNVSKKILDKPGKLYPDEIAVIRSHSYFTYSLLAGAGFPLRIVRWAAFHHERLDGQGYPFRIGAEGLDTGARLMSIADFYTALTEDRPYRKALTHEDAFAIIAKGAGTAVDPELVEVARRVLK